MRDNTMEYRRLLLQGVPLMDVRAPVEFSKGAFPGVVNLPLMNDIERQKVGTCYKQHGQQAAIELGHQLVSGASKAARIEAWVAFAKANPEGYLYCFRGGLRSQIVQQWLKSEAGIEYPRVTGGYKAMRTFLLHALEQAATGSDWVLLGGMTGTGKTELIVQLDNSLDLEGHANHRGSSFGKRVTAQPAQISFENALAVDILKKQNVGINQLVLEDEGRTIGACAVPLPLHRRMQTLPLVWLEDSLNARVGRILKDYVIDLSAEYIARDGEEAGFTAFAGHLEQSLTNILKRLGGERYKRLASIMQQALREQEQGRGVDTHRGWIEALLSEYYDPMYAFQRECKMPRIEFIGAHAEVLAYLQARNCDRAGH